MASYPNLFEPNIQEHPKQSITTFPFHFQQQQYQSESKFSPTFEEKL
jgi:hypothetical protein